MPLSLRLRRRPPSHLPCGRRKVPALTLVAPRGNGKVAKWAEPCLQASRPAGTAPSAPVVGRSRLQASRQRVIAGQRAISDRDLPPSSHAELLTQHVRMSLRRTRGNAKPLADFHVRAAGGDELDDFDLSWSERGQRSLQRVVHGAKLLGRP